MKSQTKPVAAAVMAVILAANTAAGAYASDLPAGTKGITCLPAVTEIEGNDSKNTANLIYTHQEVYGKIDKDGDVDWYKIDGSSLENNHIYFQFESTDKNTYYNDKSPWTVTLYSPERGCEEELCETFANGKKGFTVTMPKNYVYVGISHSKYFQGDMSYKLTAYYDDFVFGDSFISTAAKSYVYRGRALNPTVKVNTHGHLNVTKGADYDVAGKNNVNVGTASAIVKGKGIFDGLTAETTYNITPLDLSSSNAKISIPYASYTYTGKAIKPTVKVTYKGTDVIPSKDYTVSYSNNTKVGIATITIKPTSTGNLKGSYTKTFIIKPAKESITSITSTKKGAFTLKWSKATAGALGYQVLYSTTKDFSSNVHSYTSLDLNDTTENFSKHPNSGEIWYVKVRVFFTPNGKASGPRYGNYSDVKEIKVK